MYERRLCVEQAPGLDSVELTNVYASDVWRTVCVIEEMTAIREKPRAAVNGLPWCQLRQRARFTTFGGDAIDRSRKKRCQQNGVIAVPRTAETKRYPRQFLRRSAVNIDPFELTVRKKRNRTTVR